MPALVLRPRLLVLGLALSVASTAGLLWLAGSLLTEPSRAVVGPPPPSVGAETVALESGSGARLAAWVADGVCRCGAVVVLHGVRANRAAVANRVALFHEAGFATVAVDLQAHGESTGEAITFGHLERHDAVAAVALARERFPRQPVAVVGVSLGGAAAALAGAALDADAVVLEAVYADIDSATRNRLRMRGGAVGAALAPALLVQLPLRIGVEPDALRPVDAIGELDAPVLVVAGTEDGRTTPADTERLAAAAPGPTPIWWVEGAAHVDFLAYDPEGYQTHVLGFLERHLASG